jgi:plasmid stabilization system protein ParE
MKYKALLRPEVENDLKEAFLWYENKRTGLGYDFLLQVNASLGFLERNPELHRLGYKNTRKHLIKRFPYKIIYLVEKDKIIVLAVIHGKRNPNLANKRIDDI